MKSSSNLAKQSTTSKMFFIYNLFKQYYHIHTMYMHNIHNTDVLTTVLHVFTHYYTYKHPLLRKRISA